MGTALLVCRAFRFSYIDMTADAEGFLDATTAWTSTAGAGPRLRGRRAEGSGPLLHFVHGNGFCGGVYWPFLRALRRDGYGLFCHDFEAHGASDAPARFSGPRRLIERIPQVMDDQELGDGPLIGVGHSYGAALTLRVAAAQPERFRALVLLDPITMPTSVWLGVKLVSALRRNGIAEGARRRRDRWTSRGEVLTRLRGRGIYKGWTDEALACFVDHATRDDTDGSRVLCCPKSIEAEIFEQPMYAWHAYPRIRVPTLFLYGRASYPFIPWAARKAQRANPRVEVRTTAGGHCFMQEDPDGAAAIVRDFLWRHGLRTLS
jgi:pimeloyl-ACP methyl ester carboxylesterase